MGGCSQGGGGGAIVSLRLCGNGVLTLDYGNSWGNKTSSVSAWLDGSQKSFAGPYTFSKTAEIPFHNGDKLDIVEGPSGVIVINSITFKCDTTTTTTVPTTTTTHTTRTTTSTTAKTTITTTTTDDKEDKELDDAKNEWAEQFKRL